MKHLSKIINTGSEAADKDLFHVKLKALNWSMLIVAVISTLWIGTFSTMGYPILAAPTLIVLAACAMGLMWNANHCFEVSRFLFLLALIGVVTFYELLEPDLGLGYMLLPVTAIIFSIYRQEEWKKFLPLLLLAFSVLVLSKCTGYHILTAWNFPDPFVTYGEPASLSLATVATGISLFLLASEDQKSKIGLKKERENIKSIIENTPDAVWLVDTNFNMMTFNTAFITWSGQAGVRAAEGLNFLDTLQHLEYYQAVFREDFERVLATGKAHSHEQYVAIKDLEVYAELSFNPVMEKGQLVGISCVSRDISEQKKIENRLEQEKIRAEKANDAKSAFLSKISHELKTPLNAISGITQLMKREMDDNNLENLQIIQDSTDHLLSRINDMLDVSNITSKGINIENITFNLREVKSSALNLFQQAAVDNGIDILFEVEASVPETLYGDRNHLLQVINNLVGNALKFTKSGYIKVDIKKKLETETEVELQVTVADTGIGIPERAKSHLFESFKQLDENRTRNFEGMGLGLSTAKTFVNYMGGSINFTSQEGVGSTFYFEVPFSKVKDPNERVSAANNESDESGEPAKSAGKRILMVEDSDLNIMVGTKILKTLETTPSYAKGGEEALELVKEQEFDLILLDIHMPGIDGFEVAKRIRSLEAGATSPDVPIVIMSADVLETTKEKAKETGVDDFLEKPIDMQKIGNTINSLVAKG